MSHHIYQTDGFILGSFGKGEADKQFSLFTRHLGFIKARARGVRLLKSKSRFALQDFTLTGLSLVRGREEWRLVSAREAAQPFDFQRLSLTEKIFWVRINSLLRRLLHGEEKNQDLFEILVGAIHFLGHLPSQADLELAEPVLVMRILRVLGYFPDDSNLRHFFSSTDFPESLLIETKACRTKIVTLINESLALTQL